MKQLILFLSVILFLTGCADFHDEPGKSVWSEGLWILPWLTGIGAAVFGAKFYIAFNDAKLFEGEKKLGYGYLWYALGLAAITIIIIIMVIANR